MMKVLRHLHAVYAGAIFTILFIMVFPPLMIPVIFPSQWRVTGIVNRIWARLFLSLSFFPYKNEYRHKPDPRKQYIFCCNHFSYMDIPAMGLNSIDSIFVGKSAMESIPLFGFMYKRLHITVNRQSLKSRHRTFLKSCEAIDEGKSLMIFPEGGIYTKNPPQMVNFKNGAFRLAIEKQIEIIPVTIPHNWIILPDSSFLPRRKKVKVIYHEPIATQGLTLEDLESLKQKTYNIINSELKRHN